MKKNTLLLAIAALALTLTGCESSKVTKSYNEGINIIPVPVEMAVNDGRFSLKSSTKIAINGTQELEPVANYFAAKINGATGYSISVSDASSNVISLSVNPELDTPSSEGYTLDVTSNGVTIVGKSAAGVFYGMQSFLMLLPAEIEFTTVSNDVDWSAANVSIKDYPRFEYRGIMIDVTRHFKGVDFIKKQIDVLAMLKMNTLHWHFTDDQLWTIEIKKYPKLTEIGSVRKEGDGSEHKGFFTQEQIKEVVAYANERFIQVIPEIELPGHGLAALTAYPEYSCTGGPFQIRNVWGVEEDVFCAGNDATFAFLEDVLTEVAPLFNSEYIHIGGDECPKLRWEKCPKCQARMKAQGLKNEFELQSYFVQRIEKHVNKLGKKIIGWDEILEGGIAPSATVMSWRGEAGGIEAAKAGHQVIMTPNSHMYLDTYQGDPIVEPMAIGGYITLEKVYSYNPIPDTLTVEEGKLVKGVQSNFWSEYMYTEPINEYRMYPRILAVAEVAWSALDKKDYKDFERRVLNGYVRLDGHNIQYQIPMPEGLQADKIAMLDSTTLTFTNTRSLPMMYSINGATAEPYSAPLQFTDNATLVIYTVLPSGKTSPERTIKVVKEPLSPAATAAVKPGITVKRADGFYRNSKAYDAATFSAPKVVAKLNNYDGNLYRGAPFVDIFEGYFEVPEDGVYLFTTDNEQLWIDGALVISNEEQTSRHNHGRTTLALAKGLHPFKLVMNNIVEGGWPNTWSQNSFNFNKMGTKEVTSANKIDLKH